MNIHYKIIELWPDDHLIVARYWTDVLTEEMLASDSNRKEDGTPVRCRTDVTINLPIPVPTVDELDNIVKRSGPIAWLKMMEDVRDPDVDTDISHISSLLHAAKTTTLSEIEDLNKLILPIKTPETSNELTEEDIQKLIDNLKKS